MGGRGVGRHQNLVIFVPGTAPDEDVLVELTRVRKNFAEGQLLRVLKPSPHRIQPPCPVAGVCGGCDWQHLAYDEQLKQKRMLVHEALRRFSGFDLEDAAAVAPVVPSPRLFRYRNRIQIHHDGRKFGFHKRGTREIVDIADCPITETAITDTFPELRARLCKRPPGRLELFLSEDNSVTERFARPTGTSTDASSEAPDTLAQAAFAQINGLQNENLVQFVVNTLLTQLDPQTETRIFDLYAGNGNFTLPLARTFQHAKLRAVELNSKSVALARQKARQSDIPLNSQRLLFEESDVAKFLNSESPTAQPNDVFLLDPPRAGCDEETTTLIRDWAPHLIIYISCHPVTLARDLRAITGTVTGPRYELVSVQPFDMFPQTDHVETVATLRRRSTMIARPVSSPAN